MCNADIFLPANAPTEYADRAILWNTVERIEKANNSKLAREIEISLPKELSLLQNRVLVRDYVKKHFVEQGKSNRANRNYNMYVSNI